MKIFVKLGQKSGKILFYCSFVFSVSNLLEDALENILTSHNMDWIDLAHVIASNF